MHLEKEMLKVKAVPADIYEQYVLLHLNNSLDILDVTEVISLSEGETAEAFITRKSNRGKNIGADTTLLPLLVCTHSPEEEGWKTIKGTFWWLNICLLYGFLTISAICDLILNI